MTRDIQRDWVELNERLAQAEEQRRINTGLGGQLITPGTIHTPLDHGFYGEPTEDIRNWIVNFTNIPTVVPQENREEETRRTYMRHYGLVTPTKQNKEEKREYNVDNDEENWQSRNKRGNANEKSKEK